MPVIKEYMAPEAKTVTPQEGGAEAYRSAGSEAIRLAGQTHEIESQEGAELKKNADEIGTGLREAQQLQDKAIEHQGQAEATNILTKGSQAVANWTLQFSKDKANATDPNFVTDQVEKLHDVLSDIDATTPQGQRALAEMQARFIEGGTKQIVDEHARANGAAVVSNIVAATNNYTSSIVTNPTVSNTDMQLSLAGQHYRETINLEGATDAQKAHALSEYNNQQAHIASTLVHSLFNGDPLNGIPPNPAAAVDAAKHYAGVLGGEEVTKIEGAAAKAQNELNKQAQADTNQQVKADTQRVETNVTQLQTSVLQSMKPDGTMDTAGYRQKLLQYQQMPGAQTKGGAAAIKSGYEFIDRADKAAQSVPKGLYNPTTSSEIIDRLVSGERILPEQMEQLLTQSSTVREFALRQMDPNIPPVPPEFKDLLDQSKRMFLGDSGGGYQNISPQRLKAWNGFQDAYIKAYEKSVDSSGNMDTTIWQSDQKNYILRQLGPTQNWFDKFPPEGHAPAPGTPTPPEPEKGPLGKLGSWFYDNLIRTEPND